jgi:hypothetical protein
VPAARLMVFDEDTVYGFGRHRQYYRWTAPLEFELFAADKQAELVQAGTERKPIKKDGKRTGKSRDLPVTRFIPSWAADTSIQATALVLAGDTLFVAGPPDVEDEEERVTWLNDARIQEQMKEQSAAFKGQRGALLTAVS